MFSSLDGSCWLRPLIPLTSLLVPSAVTHRELSYSFFFNLLLSVLALCKEITVMEVSASHNDTHSAPLSGKSDLIIGTMASLWRDRSHCKAGLVLPGTIMCNPSQNKSRNHNRSGERHGSFSIFYLILMVFKL